MGADLLHPTGDVLDAARPAGAIREALAQLIGRAKCLRTSARVHRRRREGRIKRRRSRRRCRQEEERHRGRGRTHGSCSRAASALQCPATRAREVVREQQECDQEAPRSGAGGLPARSVSSGACTRVGCRACPLAASQEGRTASARKQHRRGSSPPEVPDGTASASCVAALTARRGGPSRGRHRDRGVARNPHYLHRLGHAASTRSARRLHEDWMIRCMGIARSPCSPSDRTARALAEESSAAVRRLHRIRMQLQ